MANRYQAERTVLQKVGHAVLCVRSIFASVVLVALVITYSTARADTTSTEARDFNVYFTAEDAVITPEAAAVIREVKLYYDRGPNASVEVRGHADRQGSRYYNLRLSKRRARAAAGALISLGVVPQRITTIWSGETQLPHPTSDGVSLSLNRVALVTVHFAN